MLFSLSVLLLLCLLTIKVLEKLMFGQFFLPIVSGDPINCIIPFAICMIRSCFPLLLQNCIVLLFIPTGLIDPMRSRKLFLIYMLVRFTTLFSLRIFSSNVPPCFAYVVFLKQPRFSFLQSNANFTDLSFLTVEIFGEAM